MVPVRCGVNSSTWFTPNRLMPGREVTQLVQLMARMVEEGTSVHTFVERTQEERHLLHELTREALREQQRRQKRDCDRHAVGGAVLLMNLATKVGQSKKLAALWSGPFIIVQVVSPVLYKVASSKKE